MIKCNKLGSVRVIMTEEFDPNNNKFCQRCGQIILIDAVICPKCGVKQSIPNVQKNKVVAGVLGIILGSLGIHKFYLNQPVWGIFYILFCWSGIPALAGFIEGIIYLCMSDEEFAYKYC